MNDEQKIELYPLKFKPLFMVKPWGGDRLKREFGFPGTPSELCGEAWLLSAVPGNETVVANGMLKGNTLSEVYEVFMDELTGSAVQRNFSGQFPLLIKILDASQWLSIQVHPDDDLAKVRYGTTGKNEMWYILDAEQGAQLISGFAKELDRNALLFVAENGLLPDVVHYERVSKGDVFYTPAGRIHAIGPGILLVEIQQTSDITYRLYDWDRTNDQGISRETHIGAALDAVHYELTHNAKTSFDKERNGTSLVLATTHFTTSFIWCDCPMKKDYTLLDSFVIWLVIKGKGTMRSEDSIEGYQPGEVILLPAITGMVELRPDEPSEILEVYI